MLRIALCDDEEKQLNHSAAMLNTHFSSRPDLSGQVETFRNGSVLLARAEKAGGFDLYVLDILMPELSGIDTGRRLRALGDGGEIIYLTSSNDFAADSYDVRAFFYLLKPVNEGKLFHVLDAAAENLKRRRSSAVVVTTADGPGVSCWNVFDMWNGWGALYAITVPIPQSIRRRFVSPFGKQPRLC